MRVLPAHEPEVPIARCKNRVIAIGHFNHSDSVRDSTIATGAGGWQNHRRAGDNPIPPYLPGTPHTAQARQLSQPLLGDPKRRGCLLDADKLTLSDHRLLSPLENP